MELRILSDIIEKGRSGWRGETVYEMADSRRLTITTRKASAGGLYSAATVAKYEQHEGYATMTFALYGDYAKTLAQSSDKCTEKAVRALHTFALASAAGCMAQAVEFYRVKAAHPELVSHRQIFAQMEKDGKTSS